MASTSKIVEVEETPNLLERFTSLEVSDKETIAKRQREKHRQLALEKRFQKSLSKGKGKQKESVHPEPSSPIAPDVGNVRVFEETPVEERLNWGTNSANDDHSDVNDEIAESAGLDTCMYHTSHLYDDGDGHDTACYDHYELSRQVVPLFLEPNCKGMLDCIRIYENLVHLGHTPILFSYYRAVSLSFTVLTLSP